MRGGRQGGKGAAGLCVFVLLGACEEGEGMARGMGVGRNWQVEGRVRIVSPRGIFGETRLLHGVFGAVDGDGCDGSSKFDAGTCAVLMLRAKSVCLYTYAGISTIWRVIVSELVIPVSFMSLLCVLLHVVCQRAIIG